jgi:hypothetical protein
MVERRALMDEITTYIKKNLRKGYTKESLRWALLNQGYSKIEVEKALKKVDIELAKKAPILQTKPEINYEVIEPEEYSTRITIGRKPLWKKLFDI